MNNRDHRKIMVIDGKVGFTGGYNSRTSISISRILTVTGRIPEEADRQSGTEFYHDVLWKCGMLWDRRTRIMKSI